MKSFLYLSRTVQIVGLLLFFGSFGDTASTRNEPHGNSRIGIIEYLVFLQILCLFLVLFFCLFFAIWGARVQDQRTSVTCPQSRGGRSCRARLMNSVKTFKKRWTRGIFVKTWSTLCGRFTFLQVVCSFYLFPVCIRLISFYL